MTSKGWTSGECVCEARISPLEIEPSLVRLPWSGCWIWMGGDAPKGYGCARIEGRTQRVHRVLYKLLVGNIPEGKHLLHRCDVPSCANPDHLFVGTNLENIKDSQKKGRRKGVTRRRPSGLTYKPQSIESRLSRMKFSDKERDEMKRLAQDGVSLNALARKWNTSWSTVRRAIRSL